MSSRAIASVLGVSPSTAHRDIVKTRKLQRDDEGNLLIPLEMGRDGRVRPGFRYDTSGRDDLIVRRRSEGIALRAIASEAQCSVGTVHRVLKLRGY